MNEVQQQCLIQCLIQDECPICLGEINNSFVTECNHAFCSECIHDPGMKQIVTVMNDVTIHGVACPLCRGFVLLDEQQFSEEDGQRSLLDKIIADTCCKLFSVCVSFGSGILICGTITEIILNTEMEPVSMIISGFGGIGMCSLYYLYQGNGEREEHG